MWPRSVRGDSLAHHGGGLSCRCDSCGVTRLSGLRAFTGGAEFLPVWGAAAVGEIGEQSKNREIKHGIHADGDAEKPAERPGKRFVRGGHDEFRKLQAGRKKGDKRNRECGFTWHREGQGKKSH